MSLAPEVQFQGEVARALGAVPTEVGKELDRLTDIGMLQKLPRLRRNDRQNYVRHDHWLWDVVTDIARHLGAGEAGDGS